MPRTIARLAAPVLAPALALVLAGCAGGGGTGIVTHENIEPTYQPNSASVFAAGGAPTVIRGTTYDGASPEEIAAAIRLPASLRQRDVNLATTAQTGPHLVLIFGANSAGSPDRICGGEGGGGGGATADELRVYGVFCSSSNTSQTEALLTLKGPVSPKDENFAHRMSVLMHVLLPSNNSEFGAGCISASC